MKCSESAQTKVWTKQGLEMRLKGYDFKKAYHMKKPKAPKAITAIT